MSATPHSTLANPDQRIADLERQLAEALEQQTATAEVLQVINSSPGNLAPVFDMILEKAHLLCGAAFGALGIYDGDQFRVAAAHGVADFTEYEIPVRSDGDSPLERLTRGERLVHVADVRTEDAYRDLPAFRSDMDRHNIRTLLLVPLRKEGALLGAISAYSQEVRPFTDKQMALLQNFAAQAVIAMENARLLTETREALEQQTATAEVLQVINSSPGDLAPVFAAILDKAHSLCGVDRGALVTYDGERFLAVATHGMPERYAEVLSQPYRADPGTPNDRLLRGERFVHIPDLAKAVPLAASGQAGLEAGSRTVLLVALRNKTGLLGYISAHRTEVRPFADKEIALLENFAAQAVIAMENARLLTETREALEQQTATAEVLQVINSSPGDLTPVFNAILEKAHTLCGAAHGALATYDGEYFRAVAVNAMPEPFGELLRQAFRSSSGGSAQRRLLQGERLIHIPDVTAIEPTTPIQRASIDAGVRTLLIVPLRKDDALLGYISAHRREVRPFSDKEIALLQNFAAQAVIAMENARLLGELQRRTGDLEVSLEYQTATSDVLKVISRSTFDLKPVLDTVCETAARLCDADFGALSTREGDAYRVRATSALVSEFDRFLRGQLFIPSRATVTGRALLERQTVHIPDAAADPELVIPEAISIGRLRTMLGVPLLHDGEPIGVFVLSRQRVEPFTERQMELVCTFADQAVIAIQNTRLLDELRQRTDEVAELNRGLEARVAEQVDELGRVGRLKRFLAPQLAELIVSQGDEKILESHRREIVVVFCDLRGYTAFTETAEPEEVLESLREYHGALGPLVSQFEGTLDQFSGDGIMVFFNDPVPCPDPAERAVKMAMAMREAAGTLIADWRERGRDLGFGAGIAQGYATLGQIGFSERSGYTAIGTVCNVAARLCAEAKDGQILLSQRVNVALRGSVATEQVGALALKGLTQPVVAYNVPLAATQPALRVIEGGPQSV
jgi:adenylate cyclase